MADDMIMSPGNPIYLCFQILQLRFEIQNGRDPTDEEDLSLLQQSAGCTREEAEVLMSSIKQTVKLEDMIRELSVDLLPTVFSGAPRHAASRQ